MTGREREKKTGSGTARETGPKTTGAAKGPDGAAENFGPDGGEESGTREPYVPSSRIRQTAQRILAEAARALAKEPVPRRRAAKKETPELPRFDRAEGLGPADRERLVEVVDADGRPLAAMTPKDALKQGLRFRMAAVALRTADNTLLLMRRKEEKTGRYGLWDIGTGAVRVGEAREDAAFRLLAELAGIRGIQPREVARADDAAGFSYDLALFVADLPKGLMPWSMSLEMLTLDRDELEGVLRESPELFSAELAWAAGTGRLFEK